MDKCHSSLQFRTKIVLNQKSDSQFYELLIKLYTNTLKDAFKEVDEKDRVTEEVSRLFRGNCFNSTRREHEKEIQEIRFPILKEDLKNLNLKVEF